MFLSGILSLPLSFSKINKHILMQGFKKIGKGRLLLQCRLPLHKFIFFHSLIGGHLGYFQFSLLEQFCHEHTSVHALVYVHTCHWCIYRSRIIRSSRTYIFIFIGYSQIAFNSISWFEGHLNGKEYIKWMFSSPISFESPGTDLGGDAAVVLSVAMEWELFFSSQG